MEMCPIQRISRSKPLAMTGEYRVLIIIIDPTNGVFYNKKSNEHFDFKPQQIRALGSAHANCTCSNAIASSSKALAWI